LARDFKTIEAELKKDFVGLGFTPAYASPQIITGENINEKTDIW
jgi:hypothetical protein